MQVARRGIEPRASWSASQELHHSATAAPNMMTKIKVISIIAKCACKRLNMDLYLYDIGSVFLNSCNCLIKISFLVTVPFIFWSSLTASCSTSSVSPKTLMKSVVQVLIPGSRGITIKRMCIAAVLSAFWITDVRGLSLLLTWQPMMSLIWNLTKKRQILRLSMLT